MRLHVGGLEDCHKAVTRGLIDITASLVNPVKLRSGASTATLSNASRPLLALTVVEPLSSSSR
jgi:hypothetical protein